MQKMKRLRLILVALAVMIVAVAMATEPSKITVRYQGKRYYVHEVKEGDTLYSLSVTYGVTQESIIEVNGLVSNDLHLGSKVYVPFPEAKTEEAKTEDTKPAEGEPGDSEDVHIVQPGETLYSLARAYGLEQQELLDMNNLKDHTDIKAGMTLRVKRRSDNTSHNANKGDSSSDGRHSHAGKRRNSDGAKHKGDDTPNKNLKEEGEEGVDEADVFSDLAPVEEVCDVVPTSRFEVVSPYIELKVTLLLPFHARGEAKENIVDFYRGVLLAMEDLKKEGYSIELTVLDTKRSAERITYLIEQGVMETQLILGPVYDEEFAPILSYAEEHNIPVVSPLQYVAHESPVLFNMPAPASLKGEPVAALLDGNREVVTIYASSNDNNFVNEVRSIATHSSEIALNFKFDRGSFFYARRADGSSGEEVILEDLMRTDSEKVFVVMASSATDVDRILTTLSSTKSSIRGRGLTYGNYMVVGNREWLKMGSIDRDIFFHNNVLFVVPYYANRIEETIRLFDGRYVASYGVLPSRTSYRGYDAAMIFCRMMYEGFDNFLSTTHTPLTTPYRFEYLDGAYTNTNWVRQHYRHDSKIVVE